MKTKPKRTAQSKIKTISKIASENSHYLTYPNRDKKALEYIKKNFSDVIKKLGDE